MRIARTLTFCILILSYRKPVFAADRSFATWGQYLGGADSPQYSSLKQVNKSNIKQLEIAWKYPIGPGPTPSIR
jgi:quinoprotein glucose dehydrogenase